MIVVADAGPIIHLSRIGHLDLIPFLYGRIIVPRQVYDEVVRDQDSPPGSEELRQADWVEIEEREIRSKMSRLLESHLDAGEVAALAWLSISKRISSYRMIVRQGSPPRGSDFR